MSGNVIPNATPIQKTEYNQALLTIQSILPNGIHFYPFGSAGKKQISGDIDAFLDIAELTPLFQTTSEKELRIHLSNYFKNQSLFSARTGISVHVGIPVNNLLVQVDFMTVHHAKAIQELHNHEYLDDLTSGKTIVSMWCDLAKYASPDFMISPYKGLCNRTTKEVITNDKDTIAKMILSPSATSDDMRSASKILAAITDKHPIYNNLIDRYSL